MQKCFHGIDRTTPDLRFEQAFPAVLPTGHTTAKLQHRGCFLWQRGQSQTYKDCIGWHDTAWPCSPEDCVRPFLFIFANSAMQSLQRESAGRTSCLGRRGDLKIAPYPLFSFGSGQIPKAPKHHEASPRTLRIRSLKGQARPCDAELELPLSRAAAVQNEMI